MYKYDFQICHNCAFIAGKFDCNVNLMMSVNRIEVDILLHHTLYAITSATHPSSRDYIRRNMIPTTSQKGSGRSIVPFFVMKMDPPALFGYFYFKVC